MLNQKENYKAKKKLTKVIRNLFLKNSGLIPEKLLNATVNTEDDVKRFWKGAFGLFLIFGGLFLFLRLDWTLLISIVIIPIGILVLRDAWNGKKKKVRDYLLDLADLPPDLPIETLDSIVKSVFKNCGSKFKGGGGEFGGGGASGSWETPQDPLTSNTLEIPEISISVTDLGDSSDILSGAGELAGELAGGILEGLGSI